MSDVANRHLVVSLGLEAPLFWPLRLDATMNSSRGSFEGSYAATVSAGASTHAAATMQVPQLLEPVGPAVTTNHALRDDPGRLYVWEAFVPGKTGKGYEHLARPECVLTDPHSTHACDAAAAAVAAHDGSTTVRSPPPG